MTNSYYKISLDIHNHGSYISLKAKKGATDRILHITLTDGSRPYAITCDSYAVFTARKSDGNILYNKCSILGNTIVYAFTPQTTAAVGQADCEIRLYGADSKLLVSARFALIVEDTVCSDIELESRTEVTALTSLVSEASALIQDVEDRLKNGDFIGPQGISGVIVPANGFFALELDSATGDLYCITEDNAPAPTFTLDDSGNLYYEIKEA